MVASASGDAGSGGRIRFGEIGVVAGIDFTYLQSPDLSTQGARLFDFDRDGWPDLYFTQGSRWPGDPAGEESGAEVTVRAGSTKQVHQLTAGDGYQASNPRQLVIGLGGAEQVEELSVSWPSGQTTRIENIDTGGEVVVIEGVGTTWRLPR